MNITKNLDCYEFNSKAELTDGTILNAHIRYFVEKRLLDGERLRIPFHISVDIECINKDGKIVSFYTITDRDTFDLYIDNIDTDVEIDPDDLWNILIDNIVYKEIPNFIGDDTAFRKF